MVSVDVCVGVPCFSGQNTVKNDGLGSNGFLSNKQTIKSKTIIKKNSPVMKVLFQTAFHLSVSMVSVTAETCVISTTKTDTSMKVFS